MHVALCSNKEQFKVIMMAVFALLSVCISFLTCGVLCLVFFCAYSPMTFFLTMCQLHNTCEVEVRASVLLI